MNQLIFFTYILFLSLAAVAANKLSKSCLIAFISLQAILANLFVTKQIMLFGLHATASDSLFVGSVLSLNLLQEYYGASEAKKAINISFFCMIVYAIISLFHVAYIPSDLDTSQLAFNALLLPMPRIVIASLFTYYFIQNIEYRLYAWLQIKLDNAPFILRNYLSIGFTQLLDTVIFSFLGLYGLTPEFSSLKVIGEIIIISYIIKIITIFLSVFALTTFKNIFFRKK